MGGPLLVGHVHTAFWLCLTALLLIPGGSAVNSTAHERIGGAPDDGRHSPGTFAAALATVAPSAVGDLWCRFGLGGCTNITRSEEEDAPKQPAPEHRTNARDGGLPAGGRPAGVKLASLVAAAAAEAAVAAELQQPLARQEVGPGPAARLLAERAEAVAAETVRGGDATEAAANAAADGTAGTAVTSEVVTAQAAAHTATAVPPWALALLGASVAAVAVVQLWHCLPHRGLVAQASAQSLAASNPLRLKAPASPGSADLEAVPAGWPASPPPPISAGKADDSSPPSSPASPASPAAHLQLIGVDASVRVRDISRRGWVSSGPAASGTSPRRRSEFHNPLFAAAGGDRLAEEACSSSSSSGGGSSPIGEWRAKRALALLDRGGSTAADFTLMAAAVPQPSASRASSSTSEARGAAAHLPRPAAAAPSRRSASGELPLPGSPGKAPRGAARKLKGAKSIGQRDLPLVEEEEGPWEARGGEEAAPAPSALQGSPAAPGATKPPPQGSLQPSDNVLFAAGRAASVLDSGAVAGQPVGPSDALRGLHLLTPQQFAVGWCGCVGAQPGGVGSLASALTHAPPAARCRMRWSWGRCWALAVPPACMRLGGEASRWQ